MSTIRLISPADPPIREQIFASLRIGATDDEAAAAAGVRPETLAGWLCDGDDARARAEETGGSIADLAAPLRAMADFADDVRRAKAERRAVLQNRVFDLLTDEVIQVEVFYAPDGTVVRDTTSSAPDHKTRAIGRRLAKAYGMFPDRWADPE